MRIQNNLHFKAFSMSWRKLCITWLLVCNFLSLSRSLKLIFFCYNLEPFVSAQYFIFQLPMNIRMACCGEKRPTRKTYWFVVHLLMKKILHSYTTKVEHWRKLFRLLSNWRLMIRTFFALRRVKDAWSRNN